MRIGSMKRVARSQTGAHSAEFACALFVFFLMLLFPLINLAGFAMAAGTQYMLTVQAVSNAGTAATYPEALTAMETTARGITSSGFGKFANLSPAGGFSGSGADLFIQRTTLGSGSTTTVYGPNTPYVDVIDKTNNVYEYQVRSIFNVQPFLNLAAIPFIGNVPMIGQPIRLSFVANRLVEDDKGLVLGGTGRTLASGGPTPPTTFGSYTPGTGGGGALPSTVTFTTFVPDGPNGGYNITINGYLVNGQYIDFHVTGQYQGTNNNQQQTTITDDFNANNQDGQTTYQGTNPNDSFEFTDYHSVDAAGVDPEFDITQGGDYSDAADHLATRGQNDLIVNGNNNIQTQAISDAVTTAFGSFSTWASSNGF